GSDSRASSLSGCLGAGRASIIASQGAHGSAAPSLRRAAGRDAPIVRAAPGVRTWATQPVAEAAVDVAPLAAPQGLAAGRPGIAGRRARGPAGLLGRRPGGRHGRPDPGQAGRGGGRAREVGPGGGDAAELRRGPDGPVPARRALSRLASIRTPWIHPFFSP